MGDPYISHKSPVSTYSLGVCYIIYRCWIDTYVRDRCSTDTPPTVDTGTDYKPQTSIRTYMIPVTPPPFPIEKKKYVTTLGIATAALHIENLKEYESKIKADE